MRRSITRRYLNYIQRPILAFFRMPGSGGFGVLLIIFGIILVGAILDLSLNYVHPETGKHLDLVAAIYAVFTLLVLETAFPLPESWITRAVYFAVPISGILVLGQGLVRLGSTLLNRDVWNRAMASTYKDHTIICGLGKVSQRVIQWIMDLGDEVVVVESNPHNIFIDEIRRMRVPIILGDARRPEILTDAGIRQAQAIVPCTNDDLINLSVALEARRLVPDIKVVLRMFDTQMAANIRTGFGIHTAFSIPELSAPAFAAAASKAPLDYAFSFGEGDERSLLTITKFTLVEESILIGYSIGQLEDEFNVAVIALRHVGKFMLHPHDDEVLTVGDRFIVSAPIQAIIDISGLTPPTNEMDRYKRGQWRLKQTR